MSQLDQTFIRAYEDNHQAQAAVSSPATYVQLSGTRIAARVVRPLSVRQRQVEQAKADAELSQAEQQTSAPPVAKDYLKLACLSTSDSNALPQSLEQSPPPQLQVVDTVTANSIVFTSSIAIDPESIVADDNSSDLVETNPQGSISQDASCDPEKTHCDPEKTSAVNNLLSDSDTVHRTLQNKLSDQAPLDEIVIENPTQIELDLQSSQEEEQVHSTGVSSRFESFSATHYQESELIALNEQQNSGQQDSKDLLSMHPLSKYLNEENEVTSTEHSSSEKSTLLLESAKLTAPHQPTEDKLELDHYRWPDIVTQLCLQASTSLEGICRNIQACKKNGKSILGLTGIEPKIGTTTLLLALAKKMATDSQSILMIDATSQQSSIIKQLGKQLHVAGQFGWEDALCGDHPLSEVLVRSERDGVSVLSLRGDYLTIDSISASKLAEQINRHLKILRNQFSCILVDLGNLQQTEGSSVISRISSVLVDGIVVIGDGQSSIEQLPHNTIGVIENFHAGSSDVRKVG